MISARDPLNPVQQRFDSGSIDNPIASMRLACMEFSRRWCEAFDEVDIGDAIVTVAHEGRGYRRIV